MQHFLATHRQHPTEDAFLKQNIQECYTLINKHKNLDSGHPHRVIQYHVWLSILLNAPILVALVLDCFYYYKQRIGSTKYPKALNHAYTKVLNKQTRKKQQSPSWKLECFIYAPYFKIINDEIGQSNRSTSELPNPTK